MGFNIAGLLRVHPVRQCACCQDGIFAGSNDAAFVGIAESENQVAGVGGACSCGLYCILL